MTAGPWIVQKVREHMWYVVHRGALDSTIVAVCPGPDGEANAQFIAAKKGA